MPADAPPGTDATAHVHDDVVIGSSPLMLMQAQRLARAGRDVCLIDRDPDLGGSWKIARLPGGEAVEIACHLIEVFPGVYEDLAEASGAPMVDLVEQPIRIDRRGRVYPYFSRLLMLASLARLVLGWIKAWVDVLTGRAPDRNRLINFQTKLSSYLRHQWPTFVQPRRMKGPRDGFVDFMDRLVDRTRDAGVRFDTFDVAGMEFDADGTWVLSDAEGRRMRAEHVHITTSTNLRKLASGQYRAKPQTFARRPGKLVDVAADEVLESQTYVAFWRDPAVPRISRIDMPGERPYQRFLVEFHETVSAGTTDLEAELRDRMVRAQIVARGADARIVADVDCMYTTNVDQLRPGRVDSNLWGYYSMGNLAAGIAGWRKTATVPPLRRDAAQGGKAG